MSKICTFSHIKSCIRFFFSCSFLLFVLQGLAHATAGAYVYFKNNCTYPVNFITGDDKLNNIEKTISLGNHQIKSAGYFRDTSKGFSVTHDGKKTGSVTFWLHDDWEGNYLETRNLSGQISIDREKMTWHNWYGTPSFTITACPLKIDIPDSPIFSDVDRIIIFGDSLSDKGTLHEYTQGIIPKSGPYYSGMFSNGDTWSVILKNELKGVIPVSNYSVGGATAVFRAGANLPYTIKGQFEVYGVNNLPESPQNQIAFILIGANDYLTVDSDMSDNDIDSRTSGVIENIKWLIDQLRSKGVKKFVVLNLPDLGNTPESAIDLKNNKVTSALTREHNRKLEALINSYTASKIPGEHFYPVDLYKLFDEMKNDTQAFNRENGLNITDTTHSCWNGDYTLLPEKQQSGSNGYFNQVKAFNTLKALPHNADTQNVVRKASGNELCSNPENYLFWDRVHPTALLHAAFYRYVKNSLGIKTLPKNPDPQA